ncbi:hypothetical protein C7S16_1737 [Burkholderia thailandensis]|uniref:Uncharacterized protein n=1 Tax=Burkholderia thailandensis TaxID=57975 RepID=A0AAW9D756_BURTH|nr:hypothetical protein [Burkholderia thailandensis]MDW9257771.1 hypothetical protein [Burkholderia thailandensis]
MTSAHARREYARRRARRNDTRHDAAHARRNETEDSQHGKPFHP